MERDLRGVVLGFLGVGFVLGVLFWVVGIGQVVHGLSLLDPRWLLLMLATGCCWLVSWGLALRQVLGSLGVRLSPSRAVLLYTSAEFANNVTPFGQAGGEPFSALLIAHATDSPYPTGLAAIASVDTINFVPSIVFTIVGLGYYVTVFAAGHSVRVVAGVVGALATGVPIVGYLLWTNRTDLSHVAARRLEGALARLATVSPVVPTPSQGAIHEGIDSFLEGVERVGRNPRDLGLALFFSSLGWVSMCLTLYVALRALAPTAALPPSVVFVVVPVATIAAVLPLPGGEGGVEAALVLLLVPITGITAALATSIAVAYRVGTYWLATVLGGGATLFFEGPTGRPWTDEE